MGQKSNINSLRLLNQTNLSNNNIKLNLLEITVIKYLRFLFKIKGIQLSKTTVGFTNNKVCIYFYVFFSTQRIVRLKKSRQLKYVLTKPSLAKLFKKIFKLLKYSLLEIKILNLNKQIDKALARQVFFIYKKYLNNLFEKKFYMCIDITKITILFLLKKIDNKNFLDQIGKLFSGIHKKNHLRYFKLISSVFNFLLTKSVDKNKILGIKLQVSGKLMGKAIASQQIVSNGSIPTQTLNKNIFFEKLHAYTIYGVFGFKMWIHRNNN